MAEESVKRRLAAILAADVVGFSQLMGANEMGTLAAWKERLAEVIEPRITSHDGRIFKIMGDGILVKFNSAVDAVQCSIEIQNEMAVQNADDSSDTRFELRIGINLDDVILDEDDIFGDGVNIAARLETLAEPGSVCISGSVHQAIANKLPKRFEFTGEQRLKNIEKPVEVYRLTDMPHPSAGTGAVRKRSDLLQELGYGKPFLAVKPFENLSTEEDQGSIANSISSGLVVALIRVPHLILVGDETPSMQRSKKMSLEEFGQIFGVQYVLKGNLQKLGGQLRVNAELVEVSNGRYLWAGQFDREVGDVSGLFKIQDAIIEEIVTALEIQLVYGEADRLARGAFRNPMALQSYYNGEALLWDSKNNAELNEAQRLLELSIELEPESATGYATASLAYWLEALSGQCETPSKTLDFAVTRAQEAIRRDDVTGYPHLVLAQVHLSNREFDDAETHANSAVLARPSCPAAYSLKAAVLNFLGRSNESIEFAQFALRLTPVHPPMYPAILANALYGCERYHEAIEAAQSAINLDSGNVEPYLALAACNGALKCKEDALWAVEKVRRLHPNFKLREYAQKQPYKEQHRLDRLIRNLREAGLD
ncbi:adenylate/guanylate cyclase domain-containing protein [Ruegeria atlantica]|uniref:adenylate/guanylate cyclase domain-containing protein n=1 Tax=Ruegeria atlantica TaxID=81569 RepID=UPI001480F6D7|nr:adenylate/guanylate cyclase domain-containing protein [Ruegeria atlantica]